LILGIFKQRDAFLKNRTIIFLLMIFLIVAIVATFLLRIGDGGLPLGAIFICSWSNVPAPEFPDVFLTFAVEPFPIYLIFSGGITYLLLLRQTIPYMAKRKSTQFISSAGTKVSVLVRKHQVVSFLVGLATILLTVFGPIAAYDSTFLSLHMVQHFVLITIAPPLLLFGAPMTVLMVAMGSSKRRRYILPLLHSSLFRFFTHPLVGIALFIIVPTFWYVTPAFASSLTSVPLHFIGYAVFLFAGIHYWWPIVGNNPTRWTLSYPVRLVYVLALVPIHAFLGLLFHEPDNVIYEQFLFIPRTWGPSPLLDQQIAGAFMFIFGEAVGLIVVMIVAVQWSRYEDRVGKRLNVMLDKNQHIRSLKEN